MKPKHLFVALVSFTVLMTALTLFANVIRLPPDPSKAVGVWLGLDEDNLGFLRLELDEDGQGFLSIKYQPHLPPHLYRVEKWQLVKWTVKLDARPLDDEKYAITFKEIEFSSNYLKGKFGGRGWERRFTLFNERTWSSQVASTQEQIAKYRELLKQKPAAK
jgi:hypothetical protein